MKINRIMIRKVENKGSLKAFVDFVIDDCFAVHNAKIIEGKNGLFVAMPSKKTDNEFRDIIHPIKQETREQIEKAIFEEYNKIGDTDEN